MKTISVRLNLDCNEETCGNCEHLDPCGYCPIFGTLCEWSTKTGKFERLRYCKSAEFTEDATDTERLDIILKHCLILRCEPLDFDGEIQKQISLHSRDDIDLIIKSANENKQLRGKTVLGAHIDDLSFCKK